MTMADKNDSPETRLPLPADAGAGARNGSTADPATTVVVVATGNSTVGETNGMASRSIDLPVIDAPSETNETVSPVLICAAPVVGYPREVGRRLVAHPRSALEFAALSSQERCVLLSRFTC